MNMNKRFKKLLAFGLALTLSAASLTGCGNGNSAQDGSKNEGTPGSAKLTFGIWDKNQQKAMQSLCNAYTKQNPNVSIEIQLTPYKGSEYWTKLEASMNGGTAPDVFWINALHVEKYLQGGMLEPLDTAVKAANFDLTQFPPALVSQYTFDNKLYAVPKDFDTNAVWYNKEIFDAAGVSYPQKGWTWEQMVETAKKLTNKEKGIYGIGAPLDSQTCYYSTMYANGSYVLNKEKTATGFSDPKAQKGIQCWIDLINSGLSPTLAQTTETSADAMFESGKLGMCWAGSYMTPEYLQNEAIKDKVNLVELPSFEGKEGNVINGLGYAVYSKSKQKDEATKFALWLGGEEAMKLQGQAGAVISARNDAQKYFSETYPKLNMAAYTDKAKIATAFPACLVSSEIIDVELKYLKQAYAGQMSVADACAQIDKENAVLLAKIKK
jgi:multiple sugar transport system substrate-binding protein